MADFGITRVADVTGLDCIELPVFMAVRPHSRGVSVAQGKGATRDAAADKAFRRVDLSTETFEEGVASLGAALAQIGIVAVVHLTRSEVGISVVKVVAAGLRDQPGR
jgi:ribosomal protein S12 methylthiotransferase accessory factor YcaO